MAQLKGHLAERAAQAEAAACAVADLRQQMSKLEEQAGAQQAAAAAAQAALQRTLADQECNLAERAAHAEEAASSMARLQQRVAELQQQAVVQQAAAAEAQAVLQGKVAELEGRLEEADEEAADAAAQVQAAEQRLVDAQEGLTVRAQQLQAVEAAMDALHVQLGEARGDAERAADEAMALRRAAEECAAAIKAGDLRTTAAEKRAAELAQRLAAAEGKVKEWDGIILDLEVQLSAAENSLAVHRAELEAATARAVAAEVEAAAAQASLAERANELEAKVGGNEKRCKIRAAASHLQSAVAKRA